MEALSSFNILQMKPDKCTGCDINTIVKYCVFRENWRYFRRADSKWRLNKWQTSELTGAIANDRQSIQLHIYTTMCNVM